MNSSLLFGIALAAYLAASVAYITHLAFRRERVGAAVGKKV